MTARVQQAAPDFSGPVMENGSFKNVSLADYSGRYLVLVFYPLDFTFVCPTELIAFGDRMDEFTSIGADVVGVSVDSKFSHLAWWQTPRNQGGIEGVPLPLLSDLTKEISADYGVLLSGGIALRGLFVIDPKGIVRHITMNDLPIGRSVDEALRVIQALQYHEEHGDVCPANWEPGKPSMKGDPEGSKAYFQSQN